MRLPSNRYVGSNPTASAINELYEHLSKGVRTFCYVWMFWNLRFNHRPVAKATDTNSVANQKSYQWKVREITITNLNVYFAQIIRPLRMLIHVRTLAIGKKQAAKLCWVNLKHIWYTKRREGWALLSLLLAKLPNASILVYYLFIQKWKYFLFLG